MGSEARRDAGSLGESLGESGRVPQPELQERLGWVKTGRGVWSGSMASWRGACETPLCAPISRVRGLGHLLPASAPAAPDLVLMLCIH